MVMVQPKEPTLEGASTETVILLLLPAEMLPEAELMWHQLWSVEPDQFKAAVPVFLMFKVWPGGVGPPETPVKVKVVGLRTMWGLGAELTVTVPNIVLPTQILLLVPLLVPVV